MATEITLVLLNAQSGDGTVRKQAEENLKQFQDQNLAGFLLSLAGELSSDEKPVDSRKLAGLILKNALDAKEQHRKFELVQRWLSLDVAVKGQIKTCLLQTLSSPVPDARSTASQVIAKVASIELPQKQWPELIVSLLGNIHMVPVHVKQATLETLGYLCEEVSPDVVEQDQVNKILTAVVQGMNASEGNNEVRLAATRALYNALGFAQANFTNDMERDYIMRVVCEATLSPEVKIRQAAYECLVSISSTYYEKLAPYIQDIFNITAKAVREDEEAVALQAMEFWSSICDEEIDILEDYGGDFNVADSDIPCFYFIKQALPALVPMLLETLLKQEEDQDQDEGAWNLAMAGGTCLGLVARTVGDDIVPLVMPFIQESIAKDDWRQREAATYAFGSILEGPSPDKLTPIVNVALNFMLTALTKDPNNHVKDTTAWTLGRIFEFLHGSTVETPIINQTNCQQIITVLLQSLNDVPNVAEKACGALYFLAQGFEDVGSSSPLTPYFQEIVQALLTVSRREDAGESRLRTAAYETLNEVVRCSTEETAPMVMQLVPVIMMELHNTLEAQVQKLVSDERERQNELQGLLCGCLQVIIQKLGTSEPTKYAFMQYADQIMNLFLRVFACRSATVHEEAMLAIGALAYAAGPDFAKYMSEFYKYVEMGLQNYEEYQVCAVTVGVVGDICRALEDKVMPFCDGIMTQLLKDLSSSQLHRSVKKGERYRGSSSYQTSRRDHTEGGKNYAQSAQQNVRRVRVGKRGYEDSGGTDRAAFRALEEYNYIDDKPPVSRVDMEERIQKLAKSLNGADIDMPEWMFSKIMRSAKIRFADHSMLRVIQILGKFGNWRRVLQVIEWIQARERFKSHKLRFIYTAALDALGKARRPVEALNLFYTMQKQMSTYPDIVAYHCIAVTLGQAGHLKELFDVIDSMQSSPKKKFETGVIGKWDPRLKPDIVVFNAVLNACVQRKKWEGAFWVLQQLKEEGQQPTTTTYGLIMEVMLACGKYNLVHEFFKKIHKSANALTYKVLVNTHWKEGNIDLAVRVVKEMEGRGIIGTSGLYYDLARGLCSAGRCQEALMQIDKICKVASKPLVVTYTGLIQACLDSGNIQDGVYIFKHMHKFCSPNLVTCNIMLKAYLDHEMFEEAIGLFQKLLESGNHISSKSDYKDRVIPDNYTFNLMLDACAIQQRWDDLEFIYRRMLQHEYHFNAKRHLRIILDACRAGKMELLETTWKHLGEADRLPPPVLVKQMFCLKLEQKDYSAAFACVTNHPSSDLPEFSQKSWLLFFKENSHRLQKENLVGLVHEISNVYTRSDSPNIILENLSLACREFLRKHMKVDDFDQSLEARLTCV